MDLIVECPGCETEFRIERTQGRTHVICPSCQRRFNASQAKLRKAEADTPIPRGESIDGPASQAPNPFGTFAQAHGSSSDDEVNLNAIKRLKTKRKFRHRKKKSRWPTVLGLLGLTAFVALFGGFVYHVRQKRFEMAALQKEKEVRAQPAPRTQPARRARTQSRRPKADASKSTDEIRISEPDDFSLAMADPKPDPVPVDPIPHLLETLVQSGEQCEAFQFLPENELQYEQLQKFALQLSLAKTLLADDYEGEMDSNDRNSLSKEFIRWQQTLKALVTQVATVVPERLQRINVFAKHEFDEGNSVDEENLLDKGSSQVVFYGFMFLGGNQKPHSILKFDRKQVYFSVPNVPELGGIRDETYRVFFVETPEAPSQKRMNSPGGGLIRVNTAKLVYVFDPMGSDD